MFPALQCWGYVLKQNAASLNDVVLLCTLHPSPLLCTLTSPVQTLFLCSNFHITLHLQSKPTRGKGNNHTTDASCRLCATHWAIDTSTERFARRGSVPECLLCTAIPLFMKNFVPAEDIIISSNWCIAQPASLDMKVLISLRCWRISLFECNSTLCNFA